MSERTLTRRQEVRQAREAAARRQRWTQRVITWVGGIVVLALAAAIVVVGIRAATGDSGAGPTGPVVTPAHLTRTGAFEVGKASAPVTVEIYYDYMCPACGAFEHANADELDRLVRAGTARIELRPISFLDRMSDGTRYSTRAMNAFATVADAAPASAWAFHSALYQHQPSEGSKGLTDDEIASVAVEAGVPAAVADRFQDLTYEGWVGKATKDAFAAGVSQTPTVKIDGDRFTGDLFTTGALTTAIESAAETAR